MLFLIDIQVLVLEDVEDDFDFAAGFGCIVKNACHYDFRTPRVKFRYAIRNLFKTAVIPVFCK